ncbi:double-stranded RNA-specific editase Adar [Spodoptera frugiperda]|uniref:Double-stranded RNA-specific editase Adar n=1 Tax=Spodoptera frugiperda TaxID=7108 RepID=A0A9R0E6V3_SPOFR|nr:double-stranded RNA-specific editase Adar [Spodoptera frugiperda]
MDNFFTDFTKNDMFASWTPQPAPGAAQLPAGHHTPPTRPPQPLAKRPQRDRYLRCVADGEPPAKRAAPSIRVGAGFKWNLQTLAAAADAVECGGKSPVSALNELGVRVAYVVLRQGGPAHCPSFHVAVTVADLRFEGCGHSKREARAAAARACLAALLARAGRVLPPPAPPTAPPRAPDFTSDEPHMFPPVNFQCPAPMQAPPLKPVEMAVDSSAALFGAGGGGAALKSPINVLYENYSGLTFTCTFGDGSPLTAPQAPLQLSHSMRFKVVCQVKEHKFEGYGSSKKLAKLAAARSALAALEEGGGPRSEPVPAQHGLHQTLADHIGKLVNEKFNELMKNDLVHSKRKVLAGIVITIDNRAEDARVIAVTTGTKCVSGEHMSVSGRALNDCHAEVAARRCLQRHLYAQLAQYARSPDPTVAIEDNDLEPLPGGGYRLKPSRQVHLYVSTAPCGDGRIFSPHEPHLAEPDRHPNRLARGQLRTKIESGEGTIPVKNCHNVVQTWDGVMQGERLLTMSCSDKVARWAVVGLQGALLSRLLRPVYLSSLVLGSLLHPHHMYRAICGRIESYLSCLPPPFQLQCPLLSRAASTEARTPARAPSFSVCWVCTHPLPEVINATTGKLESGQPSLLCKQSMFARWQFLARRLPPLPPDQAAPPAPLDISDTLLYNEAKQMCPAYQLAKRRLTEAFERAKLGSWIRRPLEQDQFVCELTDADPALLFT